MAASTGQNDTPHAIPSRLSNLSSITAGRAQATIGINTPTVGCSIDWTSSEKKRSQSMGMSRGPVHNSLTSATKDSQNAGLSLHLCVFPLCIKSNRSYYIYTVERRT